ncbi:MAG: hypothetical protein PGMFKBFP_01772 [Anaerolineales bacterium]|nr:hypothetical protein [Anaerolineales bacterium]
MVEAEKEREDERSRREREPESGAPVPLEASERGGKPSPKGLRRFQPEGAQEQDERHREQAEIEEREGVAGRVGDEVAPHHIEGGYAVDDRQEQREAANRERVGMFFGRGQRRGRQFPAAEGPQRQRQRQRGEVQRDADQGAAHGRFKETLRGQAEEQGEQGAPGEREMLKAERRTLNVWRGRSFNRRGFDQAGGVGVLTPGAQEGGEGFPIFENGLDVIEDGGFVHGRRTDDGRRRK